MKIIFYSILIFSLYSCANSDRMARISFVEKLVQSKENINSIIDTSQYNCWLYINPLYIKRITEGTYTYYEDEINTLRSEEKFIDGKWVLVERKLKVHNIFIKSNSKIPDFFTFHFELEDNKWCLKKIIPYRTKIGTVDNEVK